MFRTLLISSLLWSCYPVVAQVTLDGTLGKSGALPGPDYQIGADVGQQHGSNLFHSFQDFNLQSHESATFSGPANVQNIISRVTGGNPSSIDGTLRSTIPNADMYFLNPYGIMFGPNAKLDVQGGFHASTADYLRLQDGGRFEARTPGNSLLTVAPVAAFGFLTETPAALKTQDSQLSVPKGKTFSWIGGELELNGSTPPVYEDDTYSSRLFAESGRLNLASVASRGEVIPTPLGLDLQATAKLGSITSTNTLLSLSGDDGNGYIFIRGGQFQMTNGWIDNNTVTQAGGVTDIQVDDLTLKEKANIDTSTLGTGQGGSVSLTVTNNLTLIDGSIHVFTTDDTPQAGNSGNLTIQAGEVNLSDGAVIGSNAYSEGQGGDAGDILIQAREINLSGSDISSVTAGAGQGGTIHLQVSETLNATNGLIHASSQNAELENAGQAGNVVIQAREINLSGSGISSATNGTGQGGTVHLEVSETLAAKNSNIYADSDNSDLKNAGPAGNVVIQARQVDLTDGAQIRSVTFGTGQSGTVHLQVAETLTATGVDAEGYASAVATTSENQELANAGAAGNLQIEARQVVLTDGGKLTSGTWGTGQGGNLSLQVADTLTIAGPAVNGKKSSVVASSRSTAENAGSAGLLNLQANAINILNGGEISTQSENAGGGDITVLSPNLLYLQKGQLTTSVKGGKGNGGNITINNPVFVILASAKIIAQADEGKGGNIMIRANQFIATPPPSSLVSASSRLGIDGQVVISSPDPNISGKLFLVSTKGLDVTNQLKRPCGGAKSLEEIMNPRFKFYVYPIAGSRQSFEDWGPSPLPSRSARASVTGKTETVPQKPPKTGVDRSGYQPVMLVVECPKEEKGG